jgi:hypothetical protein
VCADGLDGENAMGGFLAANAARVCAGGEAMSKVEKLNPWQKIMRAAERGTGLRLNADEVWLLSRDDAIEQAATQERAEEYEDFHDEVRRLSEVKR